MKRIILMRHSQAEEGMPGMSDFERSLTQKGKNITRLMASKLKEKIKDPGTLISSPAFRAIETALIFAGVYGINADKIIMQSKLYYTTDAKSFIDMLALVNEEIDTVSFFGHNPSFSDLVNYFSKESGDVIPKSGIVSLTFDIKTWSDVKPDSGKAELFLKPKKIL